MRNKLILPIVNHHSKPNIIVNWREYGERFISFIEYPSIKIEFKNLEEVLQLHDKIKLNCIFIDDSVNRTGFVGDFFI